VRLRLLIVTAAILLTGTACNRVAGSEDSPNNASIVKASIPSNEGVLPLSWENYRNPGDVRLLKEGLKQAERIVKETKLYGIEGSEETKIVIYARKNDTENLYAAWLSNDAVYDLGAVAGYPYDQDDQLTVRNMMLFRKEVVKIQGSIGAAASLARYIEIENGVPKLLMTLDEGHASELDVDHDGLPEVVVSSQTIPHTTIYRWNDGRIERCSLNEALRAEAVSITDEGAVLAAFGKDLSRLKLYWLEQKGLKEFQTYSKDEYDSDRFVAIPYTAEEAMRVREQADGVRVFDPYVPRKGVATDYPMEVEQEQGGTLKLTFPHFAVRQSRTDLRPRDKTNVVSEKRYFPDFTAEWIGHPDSGAGGNWYITRGTTSISIGTAKPYSKEQLLYVAASLIPLDELKLSDGTVPAADHPPQITREYLFALQAVNEFASAWAHRDPAKGLQWVTDEWKAEQDPQQLDAYFRGTSNPHHMTFELSGKRRVDDRTYLFNLRLYEYYTGQPDSVHGFPADYSRGWTIEAVKQGEDEWGEGIWRVNP